MIEIKEPKFKVGDRVYCNKFKFNAVVIGISDYSFVNDKYYYSIRYDDGDEDEMIEDMFDLYIEKPKTVWELQKGDTYYLIDVTGDVIEANWLGYWLDYDNDKRSRKIGNAFLIKEEAEIECERRKIETEMIRLGGRRKFNRGKDNYYIMYDHIEKDLVYLKRNWIHEQGCIYFNSDIDVAKAVQEIGEDKIKKYIFGVES